MTMKIPARVIMQSKIPTRYDDITAEIHKAKFEQYFNQVKPDIKPGTFKLGSIAGDVFTKILK